MRVWVTGVSGYIGTRLTQVCDKDADIIAIVGMDIRPPRVESKKLKFIQADINDQDLTDKVRGANPDVGIHLAFILDPIHDMNKMVRVNLDGTRNFLNVAKSLGLKKIIVASSATAYGALSDNPMPLRETDAIRGERNRYFTYVQHKAIIDRWCQDFATENPGTRVVIVRPTIVMGPNISNYIGRIVSQDRGFTVKGANPPLQYVHEEDVARAFHFLLKTDSEGPYNLTGDGTMTVREGAEMAGTQLVEMPYPVAYGLVSVLWWLRIKPVEAPPGVLNYFRHPWVISNEKIKKLGFKFDYTTRQTFESFLRAQGKLAG